MTGKRTTKQPQTEQSEQPSGSGRAAESAAPAAAPSAEELTKRVEDLVSQLEQANERHVRLAADFENFKKRSRQERVELLQYASAQLAERLLPVLDDFARVVEHAPAEADENWLRGVRMTVDKLHEVLGSVGVEPIEAVGTHFDPKLHEAIATEESTKHPEDTVLDQVRPGYRMHDRVLRPAMVRIARLPAKD